MNPGNGQKELYLVDAYALIFRAYFAFIRNPRITSKGLNTSAIFGFVTTLEELLKTYHPSHLAIVFDPPRPTFRHKIYPEYKANRDATPEDIRIAVPYIKELAEAYRIPVLEQPGYEADDVIGTLSHQAEEQGYRTFMVTPDKDYLQLLSKRVFLLKPRTKKNEIEEIGINDLPEYFHVEHPSQVIDVLALWGDASDNIPGAPGIGEKTAKKLINQYGSLEKLYDHIDELSGKLKNTLMQYRDQIFLSRDLVTIRTDVPVSFDEKLFENSGLDEEKIRQLFKELEFKTLLQRVISPKEQEGAVTGTHIQGNLFDQPASGNDGPSDGKETIDSVFHDYHLLDTDDKIKELAETLSGLKEFCFDTETTGLNFLDAEIVGLSFSFKPHEGYYVPLPPEHANATKRLMLLKTLFENTSIRKIGQNMKFDMHMLENYDIHVRGTLFDTMLAHYLLFPEQRHNLNDMSENLLGYQPISIERLIGKKGKNQISMRKVEAETIKEYAVEDADLTWQLKEVLEPELKKNGQDKLAEEIEMPLVHVLLKMERAGIRLDPGVLKQYENILKEDLQKLEQEIHKLAGVEFNISSPKQLGEVLFEKMKIVDNAKKTKTKQYSTSEEVLTQLKGKHPIIEKVLEYRSVRKLLSSYVETLPGLVHPQTGRIHTEFNQAIAVTGRLSSANPNLQNIPVREERGREIRKAFVSSGEEYLILSADYSQIELRLMAHLSEDESMIRAFLNNQDIHAATAAKIYNVPLEEVTREMRSHAKTANFGIIYGISSFGLAQRLDISRTKAKELIDGYFKSFPGVKRYMNVSIQKARERGYAETIMGRRRYLRDINSGNSFIRSMAERNAINTPIQGSAADIIKLAMIRVQKILEEKGLKTKMILQVHDELLFDMYLPEKEEVIDLVVYEMENVVKLKVPLTVDYGIGRNWLEAH
ncbi:MAG TPA: DNA polymerase I [Bacteroidetes bacterium]|nr:DNA polymerase I [Bacteroidota bacterium]